jgi:endo-1,4-beta-xylanase
MRPSGIALRALYAGVTLLTIASISGCAHNQMAATRDGLPLAVAPTQAVPQLKSAMAAHFKVGAAIEPDSIDSPADAALLAVQFSSLTAENKMKPGTIGVAAGEYNFAPG